MQQYNTKSFLRQVPNQTLAQFFSRFDAFADFDWSRVSERKLDPIFEPWQKMSETERETANCIFEQVHALSSSQGTVALVEAARDQGVSISEGMRACRNGHERALWCFLDHPEVFNDGRTLAHIEALPRRSWEKRNGLPKRPITINVDIVDALERELSEYYVKLQDRGEKCWVEYRRRSSGIDSFFAYPADYAHLRRGYDENGRIVHERWKGVFEVVFNYSSDDGTVEMFAQGGKKVRDELAELFAEVVLGLEQVPQACQKPSYDLECFKDPNLLLPTEPDDGIVSIRVKSLGLRSHSHPRGRIRIEVDGRDESASVFDLTSALDESKLSLDELSVVEVSFQVVMNARVGRQRRLSFKLRPSGSNLGDSPEERRLKKCFKRWGIDTSA